MPSLSMLRRASGPSRETTAITSISTPRRLSLRPALTTVSQLLTPRSTHKTEDQDLLTEPPPVPRSEPTPRRDRSNSGQSGHKRKKFSEQGRRETAAVRKAGACSLCREKKTKCRHTVDPLAIETIAQEHRVSRSPTTSSRPSTTRDSFRSQNAVDEFPPSGHQDRTFSLDKYMNQASSPPLLGGEFQASAATLQRQVENMWIMEHTNHHFSLEHSKKSCNGNGMEDVQGHEKELSYNTLLTGQIGQPLWYRPQSWQRTNSWSTESRESASQVPYTFMNTGSQFATTIDPTLLSLQNGSGNSLATVWEEIALDSQPVHATFTGYSHEANTGGLGNGYPRYDNPQVAFNLGSSSHVYEADAEHDLVNFDDDGLSASGPSVDYSTTTYSSYTMQTQDSYHYN